MWRTCALAESDARYQFEKQKMLSVESLESTVVQWYREVIWKRTDIDRTPDGVAVLIADMLSVTGDGPSMKRGDIELFIRLSRVLSPQRIFIIGNGVGFSTFVLSYIFSGASVDVLDSGDRFYRNLNGQRLTRSVAAWAKRNVSLFNGFSPKDIHHAMRSKRQPYELVFIDGLHTDRQLFLDFEGIYPHLGEHSVVVLHDIMKYHMQQGVYTILCTFTDMRFAYYTSSRLYRRLSLEIGTGFMYRGFPDEAFATMHSLEIPYRCEKPQFQKHPVIYMVQGRGWQIPDK